MSNSVHERYGNRLRVRACGLLIQDGKILMVDHRMPGNLHFWAPPGGGIELGESAMDCLKREFIEETGLLVNPGDFLFGCEYIAAPLHAVELFFEVKIISGQLVTGHDPEHTEPIIQSVRWLDFEEIRHLKPGDRHGIFRFVEKPEAVAGLRGYFTL